MNTKSAKTVQMISLAVLAVAIAAGAYFAYQKMKPQTGGNASVSDSGNNIVVFDPKPSSMIGSPLTVEGLARVFESVVSIRLSEKNGPVLAQTTTMAKAPDAGEYGPFSVQLTFSPPKVKDGVLEVYQVSAKDGSEIDKVTVPLKFRE